MISLKINDNQFILKSNISIIEACRYIGIQIPRFCYHESLSIAGNCRMCLVAIDNERVEKLVIACLTNIESNMVILTDTFSVKKARENVLEALLLNHPLDCPICDQAGECDLQDQTKIFGNYLNKIYSKRRGVQDKYCGPLIKTIMTRCIHCTRCVRFGTEIVGFDIFGTLNRGNLTEIGSYSEAFFDSNISGNVIDLCPVGALTSKPYAFKHRPWELRSSETIDLTDSLGSQIFVNHRESGIARILPKTNNKTNGNLISDTTRFSYDSIENNRIYNVHYKDLDTNLMKFGWEKVHSIVTNIKDKKVTILINEQLDLKTLNQFKFLFFLYKNITVKSHSRFNEFNNFYEFSNLSKNSFSDVKSKVCMLIGCDLKNENAIINTKIRINSLENNYKLYSLGSKFRSKLSVNFINLNIEEVLQLFEGKSKNLSGKILRSQFSEIVFGEGFKKRFSALSYIKEKIKTINFTTRYTIINSSSNTEGNFFFGIKSLNKKNLDKSNVIFCCNINDNIIMRKLFLKFRGLIVEFNTHFPSLFKKNSLLLPIKSNFFENSGVYINMLQQIQKTQKVVSSANNIKSLSFIFKKLFFVPQGKFKYLDFISESLQISKFESSFSNLSTKSFSGKRVINYASTYPLKFFLKNNLKTDTYVKNS